MVGRTTRFQEFGCGLHVRGQRNMPLIPSISEDLDFGMVFREGMGWSVRKTKQEKKQEVCVTEFVSVFSFFLF